MKKLISIAVALMLLISVGVVAAGEYKGKAVKAKLVSEEIEGDFMTVWARNFADHMKKWSDGKIEITVYPYGTLGAEGDINELCQIGVAQFVFSDYAWISAFVSQAQVLALNYLFPLKEFLNCWTGWSETAILCRLWKRPSGKATWCRCRSCLKDGSG